jgi:hypothetical protein
MLIVACVLTRARLFPRLWPSLGILTLRSRVLFLKWSGGLMSHTGAYAEL